MRGEQQLDVVRALDPDRDGAPAVREGHRQPGRVLAPGHLDHQAGVRHRQLGELGADQVTEAAGGSRPRVAQLGGSLRQRRPAVLAVPGQLLDPALVVVQLEQSQRGPPAPVQDGVRVLAVLARERGQHRAAVLDHRQARRVTLDARGVGREVGRDVGEQVPDLGEPVVQADQAAVVGAHRVQRVPGRRDEGDGVGLLAVPTALDGGVRHLRSGAQRVGVPEPGVLLPQGVVLALLRVDCLDLLQAMTQQVGLLRALAPTRHHLVQLALDR